MMTTQVTSWRPFLAGAATAASVFYCIVPLAQRALRKRRRSAGKNADALSLQSSPPLLDAATLEQRVIRKAEGAIKRRTSRLTIVVERCTSDHNYSAILRTAEALGVQNVWIIDSVVMKDGGSSTTHPAASNGTSSSDPGRINEQDRQSRSLHHLFARKAMEWLTIREFSDTASCLSALRQSDHTIWATDLSQVATSLTSDDLCRSMNQTLLALPSKLAIVFGTEAVGCTQEMLEAADLRVYLPLRGFADSLNLSVATALVVHQLFVLDPSIEGDMAEEERRDLRQQWFAKLAKQRLLTSAQKRNYVRLAAQIKNCKELEARHEGGERLQEKQLVKLNKLPELEGEMKEIETRLNSQAAIAVEDLVENPPDPITDMRRPDEHRTWFGGRNTRKSYGELWDNMPATTGYDTTGGPSSADFFRSRAANGA